MGGAVVLGEDVTLTPGSWVTGTGPSIDCDVGLTGVAVGTCEALSGNGDGSGFAWAGATVGSWAAGTWFPVGCGDNSAGGDEVDGEGFMED